MAREIDVRFTVTDGTRFELFDAVFIDNVQPRISAGLLKVEAEAKTNSPTFNSFFRNSIESVIEKPQPGVLHGNVFSSVPYAGVIEGVDEQGNEVEWGRRPGAKFPNITELRLWVIRKIGPEIREFVMKAAKAVRKLKQKVSRQQRVDFEEKEIDDATFAIGRAIKARGIRPQRPIGNAFVTNRTFINEEIDAGIDATLAQL